MICLSRTTPALLVALMLTGCAGFSDDGGLHDVSTLASQRIGQSIVLRRDADVATSIPTDAPLTAESAVRIALANNKNLQASFDALGIAEADAVLAQRLRNPGFSFSAMHGDGGASKIDRGVLFDIAGLLTLPARSTIAREQFEQAKLRTAADAVRLAGATRRAYFQAVAAEQDAQFAGRVNLSAQAGAELAQRMTRTGALSELDGMQQTAFYADMQTRLAHAQHEVLAAREKLARLLGLSEAKFTLPDHLPDLPQQVLSSSDGGAQAMQQRLDILIAKRNNEATAHAWNLTRTTGFINVLDAGYRDMNSNSTPRIGGVDVTLDIPIFDWGDAKTRKAQATYMESVHRTADVAIRARSQVREAYSAYRTNYELARRYRDEIVPLRKHIADEVALRYNSMQTGVFELLADSREQAQSVQAAIDALRNFWLADTALQMAISGDGSVDEQGEQ